MPMTSLTEDLKAEVTAEADHAKEIKMAQLRRERDEARNLNRSLTSEINEMRHVVNMFGRFDETEFDPPTWLRPVMDSKNHATLMLLLSDLHFDEVVNAAEMDGMNAYNREIAVMRMQKWTRNVIKLARHYLNGVEYDGVVLMLGGDTFSGNIHEELKETNEDTVFGSLLYWAEILGAAVDLLAQEFGKVLIVSVPGNHGRMTRKPVAKHRAKDNLDWLLSKLLEKEFKRDPRVTFMIPEASDAYFQVYGRGHLLTHGDQVTGGSGIGGIWPPIMRLRARKSDYHMVTGKPFDTLWMGHWHQLIPTPKLVINGAMKGWDEYAKISNFAYEPPQQAMAVVTPEHGITWQAPVFCSDREEEGW